MMNQQPTQLDPALSALITLQQRANPTTPNGQPTVAAKLSAQAGQGIAGALPQQGEQQERGLPGIIASAQQAAPSVAQNAQQGQMDQMAQQVAQHMQEQQQPPGVTGLPAGNMGFAEGGIIPTAHFAGGGNEGLTLGSMPQVADSGIASAFAGAPAAPSSSPDVDAARASTAEMAKLMKERPDFLAQELAALDADKQARAAAAAKQKDRQGFEALMAMFAGGAKGGMGGMGEATTAFNREVATRENAAREADRLDALLRVEKGKAAYALKIGDTAALLDARKNIAGMQNQLDQIATTREGHKVQTRGQDIVAGTAREQNASQERIAADRRAMDLRIAELSENKREKAENLRQYLDAMNAPDVKKLAESVAAAEKYNSPNAAVLRKQLNEKRAHYAKYYKLTPQEAASAFELAAPAASPAAGGTPADVAAYLKQYGKGS